VAELIVPTAIVLEVTEYGSYRFEFAIDDSELPVAMHIVSPDQLSQ
jgi:hypothetical protein